MITPSTEMMSTANTIFLRLFTVALCVIGIHPASVAQNLSKVQRRQPNGVTRYSEPILTANKALGEVHVYNPSVIALGDRLAMIYRSGAHGNKGPCFRLAFSDDGRSFTPYGSAPVLVSDSPFDKDGCEDPRVIQVGGTYYMTYVGNSGAGILQQCLATSSDLIHWDKKGVILTTTPNSWNEGQVKATVIVPVKLGGKYIMYFLGQKQAWHSSIGMAVSDDLLHWTQPFDHPIMTARPDRFDNTGVEPGAAPILLPEGILLVYNGWNEARVHRTGWVLFSNDDPSKIIKRRETPFIEPQFDYETKARKNVTFTEGAVHFKGLWRFYYGASDDVIGLAEIEDLSMLLNPVQSSLVTMPSPSPAPAPPSPAPQKSATDSPPTYR